MYFEDYYAYIALIVHFLGVLAGCLTTRILNGMIEEGVRIFPIIQNILKIAANVGELTHAVSFIGSLVMGITGKGLTTCTLFAYNALVYPSALSCLTLRLAMNRFYIAKEKVPNLKSMETANSATLTVTVLVSNTFVVLSMVGTPIPFVADCARTDSNPFPDVPHWYGLVLGSILICAWVATCCYTVKLEKEVQKQSITKRMSSKIPKNIYRVCLGYCGSILMLAIVMIYLPHYKVALNIIWDFGSIFSGPILLTVSVIHSKKKAKEIHGSNSAPGHTPSQKENHGDDPVAPAGEFEDFDHVTVNPNQLQVTYNRTSVVRNAQAIVEPNPQSPDLAPGGTAVPRKNPDEPVVVVVEIHGPAHDKNCKKDSDFSDSDKSREPSQACQCPAEVFLQSEADDIHVHSTAMVSLEDFPVASAGEFEDFEHVMVNPSQLQVTYNRTSMVRNAQAIESNPQSPDLAPDPDETAGGTTAPRKNTNEPEVVVVEIHGPVREKNCEKDNSDKLRKSPRACPCPAEVLLQLETDDIHVHSTAMISPEDNRAITLASGNRPQDTIVMWCESDSDKSLNLQDTQCSPNSPDEFGVIWV